MSSDGNALKRQGTMDQTAQEGIQYLKDSNEDALLKAQGLVPDQASNGSQDDAETVPKPTKTVTMAATTEEAGAILESMGGKPDPDVKTRQQQHNLDKVAEETAAEEDGNAEGEGEEDGSPSAKKRPRLERETTIQQTLKEAEAYLGSGEEKPKDGDHANNEAESTPGIKRTGTIDQTIREGEEFVTRGEQPSPTKTHSMEQTLQEGKDFVDGKKSFD